jgi:hypothetical protein
MGKRKRINTRAICSSLNYEATHKAHKLMLEINHSSNEDFFLEIQQSVVIENKTVSYTQVKIFGKWVNLEDKDPSSFIGFELR